ncbi:MAG: translation initiation factor 2 [Sphaerochaetaceae bacterium]|nr:translation initiation factor 2 [Sphaerochaetaceae bacterium]
MFQQDDLPKILRKEVIASLHDGIVRIHNRRIYPGRDEYMYVSSVQEIADAMQQMVTQGGGILRLSLVALLFIAEQMAEGKIPLSQQEFIRLLSLIKNARRTNTTSHRILDSLTSSLSLEGAFSNAELLLSLSRSKVEEVEATFDTIYDSMSDLGADLILDGEGIFTTCFAEHTFILSLLKAHRSGKDLHVYVPETRPYLQGARLTAPSLQELGIPVTLISDAMPAHLIQKGAVNRYMSAADTVCMDGSAANKVGTLTNAVLCSHYHLPFHLFAVSPDQSKLSMEDIEIEYRDPEELLTFRGERISAVGVHGIYPAFDTIPPSLITSIITPRGVLRPQDIRMKYVPGEGL